ncbi:hypothetical protein BH10PSE1_BH10PSE1_04940 [soil metagenome]
MISLPRASDLDEDRRHVLALELATDGAQIIETDRTQALPHTDNNCAMLGLSEPKGMMSWHATPVYFEADDAVITRRMRRHVPFQIIGYRPSGFRLVVGGHSDTFRSADDSLRVSMERANAVRDELVRLGVAWSDIELGAYGETRLAKATADGVPEQLNRRVTIEMFDRPSGR